MVAHPEDLEAVKPVKAGVCGDLDQTLCADLLRDLLALGGGALVAPDNGAAQDVPVFIEHDKAVHLAGNADAAHESRVNAGLIQHGADRVLRGVHQSAGSCSAQPFCG